MFYKVHYKINKEMKNGRIGESQAKAIQERMQSEDRTGFISIGLDIVRIFDIMGITAEDTNTSKSFTADLRRKLNAAAKDCQVCKGIGFSEKGSDVAICVCQARAKTESGMNPNDYDWSHRDDENTEKKIWT
jgi:hypothetical protein